MSDDEKRKGQAMPATDPYPDAEMALLDDLHATAPRGDSHPVLVVELPKRRVGEPKPDLPQPEMAWMSAVPNINALVTVAATITLRDGSRLDGFVKIYAPSGDLHQAWVRIDDRWDRLAHLHERRSDVYPLQDWETVVPFTPDPDWHAAG